MCVCVFFFGGGGGRSHAKKYCLMTPKYQQHPLSHKNEPSLGYCLTRNVNPYVTDRLTSATTTTLCKRYLHAITTMKRKHNNNIKLTTTSCDYDDETEYRYDEIQKEMCNKKV